MKSKKEYTFGAVLFVIILAAIAIFFRAKNGLIATESLELISDISTLTMVAIQVLAVAGIMWQLRQQEHISVANFMLDTTKELRAHTELLSKIRDKKSNGFEKSEVMELLNIYETMSSLIDKKAIEFSDIDSAFAFRFFQICHHPEVQKLELVEDAEYYPAIYRLHRKWVEYRKSVDNKIDDTNNLSGVEGINYKELSA